MRKELQRVITDSVDLKYALRWVEEMAAKGLPSGPVLVSIGRPRRTKDQNSKLWPMLNDLARQVDWYGQKLSAEDWKHVLTSSLTKQRVVPGIDGGFVVCGLSTSRMNKQLFCQLVELIYAFGSEHDVRWSEPVKAGEEMWRD